MKKHAFLIIAHSAMKDLILCCKSIDSFNHNIYLHIDKKWKEFDENELMKEIHFSKVYILKDRVSVNWGGYSQIKVEMNLFKTAFQDNNDYYHLLSGVDLMIKPLNYFDFFFEDKENEFISFCGKDWNEQALKRIKYYYLEDGRKKIKKYINKISIAIQKLLRVNRLKKIHKIQVVGGSNWCSLTHNFVKYILSKELWIKKHFSHTFCADEIFVHTIAYNSSFKDKLFLLKINDKNNDSDPDMYQANLRYIDWIRGKPYTFQRSDFEQLINCPYLFARKFCLTEANDVSLQLINYNSK